MGSEMCIRDSKNLQRDPIVSGATFSSTDVSVCPKCGGKTKVIASIEDQAVIDRILGHLMKKGALPSPPELLPATRASPDTGWFA